MKNSHPKVQIHAVRVLVAEFTIKFLDFFEFPFFGKFVDVELKQRGKFRAFLEQEIVLFIIGH